MTTVATVAGYADAAHAYLDAGWQPLPLDSGKGVVPKGMTGYGGRLVTAADVAEWSADPQRATGGLCLRLVDMVGLDLDAYDATKGAATRWTDLQGKNGPLPPTWLTSSRLGDDWDGLSGIRLFRLPAEYLARQREPVWRGNLGAGIDIVRFAHRNVNAWPQVHPSRGAVYAWLNEATGEIVEGVIPARPEDIPVLPDAWAQDLLKPDAPQAPGQVKAVPTEAAKTLNGFAEHLNWWTAGEPCQAVSSKLADALDDLRGNRHDNALIYQVALSRLGEQGHRGVAAAMAALHDEFIAELLDNPGSGRTESPYREWDRAEAGIGTQILANGLTPAHKRGCCGPAGGNQAADEQGLDGVDSLQSGTRRLVVTRGSEMTMRRVEWAWQTESGGRFPAGELAIVAGPGGRGKSTYVNRHAAMVTRGEVPGKDFGHARSVIVSATEESWETTILPKLAAAGADLDRVLKVETLVHVKEAGRSVSVGLNLAVDIGKLEDLMKAEDVGLLVLDPIISRLGKLDTHKDAEVRVALDPLVETLHNTGAVAIGIMHFNKGDGSPMKLLMGSTAFGAVARSVHVVEKDPDCPGERLFATVKANMGRDDLPMLRFRLEEATVDTADGAAVVPVAVGLGEDSSGRSFEDVQRRMRRDALAADRQASGVRTVTDEAVEFLTEWMRAHNYSGKSADIKAAAKELDIPERTLQVARARMRIEVSSRAGFGGGTDWSWPQGAVPGSGVS